MPKRTRRRTVGRIVLWFAAGLLMLALGGVGGAYLWVHERVNNLHPHSKDMKEAAKQLDPVPLPGNAAIALVVGYDHRAGKEAALGSRSDTVMLLRSDPATKSVSMLSFPRDLIVDVHCPGRALYRGRINQAYADCGAKGTLQTVKDLTGLPINYLITVNFHAFKAVVNHLGGVWIDVDRRYFNRNNGTAAANYAGINLQPGYQLLSGGSALDFVRYRHTDSDLYRLARQQQFVRALKDQLKNHFGPLEALQIAGSTRNDIEIAEGGGKQVDLGTIQSYARFLYQLPPGHFFQAKIQNVVGYAQLTTDQSNVQSAVQDFSNPDPTASKQATNVALGIKSKAPVAPPPSATTIAVLNGNGAAGSATNASYLLTQRGYRVVVPPNGTPANAPRFDYFHTKIYYRRGDRAAALAAQKVADLFGAADVGWLPPNLQRLSNGALLVATVGQTFHDTLAPLPAPKAPVVRQPPNVISDQSATRDLLRQAQRKVPFPLQVPTQIESSSRPDRQKPIAVYKITRGMWAVRLVFRSGDLFWGVEETNWNDAPVLTERNFEHRIKGRTYDLYYSGSHLHMVVLRSRNSTYWVVNTLLDDLSNDTMLGIAKGLRPLGRR